MPWVRYHVPQPVLVGVDETTDHYLCPPTQTEPRSAVKERSTVPLGSVGGWGRTRWGGRRNGTRITAEWKSTSKSARGFYNLNNCYNITLSHRGNPDGQQGTVPFVPYRTGGRVEEGWDPVTELLVPWPLVLCP